MKTLVTGATGFIGRHLVAHLSRQPHHETVAISRRPASGRDAVRTLVVEGDVHACLARIVMRERPTAIVHLAAAGVDPHDRDATRLTDVNAHWPAVLVRAAAAAGTRAVIVAGSSAEYGPATVRAPLDEDAPLEARRLYGATKAAGGLLAVASGEALDVDVAVLRFFNVFGAGEAAHRLLPSIVTSVAAGRQVPLSAGLQVRDFLEVDDACKAVLRTLEGLRERTVARGHYNVCSGIGTDVASFARGVVAAMGGDAALLRFGALPMRPDDRDWLVGDPGRFAAATGWRARDLRDGLAEAVSRLLDPSAPAFGTPSPSPLSASPTTSAATPEPFESTSR